MQRYCAVVILQRYAMYSIASTDTLHVQRQLVGGAAHRIHGNICRCQLFSEGLQQRKTRRIVADIAAQQHRVHLLTAGGVRQLCQQRALLCPQLLAAAALAQI